MTKAPSRARPDFPSLIRAIVADDAAAVSALLSHGVDPRRQHKSGSTSLHLAVQTTGRGGTGSPESRGQQEEIIRLLIRYGARPGDEDAAGKTVEQCVRSGWIRGVLKR